MSHKTTGITFHTRRWENNEKKYAPTLYNKNIIMMASGIVEAAILNIDVISYIVTKETISYQNTCFKDKSQFYKIPPPPAGNSFRNWQPF